MLARRVIVHDPNKVIDVPVQRSARTQRILVEHVRDLGEARVAMGSGQQISLVLVLDVKDARGWEILAWAHQRFAGAVITAIAKLDHADVRLAAWELGASTVLGLPDVSRQGLSLDVT